MQNEHLLHYVCGSQVGTVTISLCYVSHATLVTVTASDGCFFVFGSVAWDWRLSLTMQFIDRGWLLKDGLDHRATLNYRNFLLKKKTESRVESRIDSFSGGTCNWEWSRNRIGTRRPAWGWITGINCWSLELDLQLDRPVKIICAAEIWWLQAYSFLSRVLTKTKTKLPALNPQTEHHFLDLEIFKNSSRCYFLRVQFATSRDGGYIFKISHSQLANPAESEWARHNLQQDPHSKEGDSFIESRRNASKTSKM